MSNNYILKAEKNELKQKEEELKLEELVKKKEIDESKKQKQEALKKFVLEWKLSKIEREQAKIGMKTTEMQERQSRY